MADEGRSVNIHDVARKAGVAVSSVSRVLLDLDRSPASRVALLPTAVRKPALEAAGRWKVKG